MNDSLNVKIIKYLIILFENFQSYFNIDIYSILRVKKEDNNKFIEDIFSKSHEKWLLEYQKQTKLKIIHNIAFNYWIRSHAAYKYNQRDTKKIIFYSTYIIYYLVRLFFFIIKVCLFEIIIKENNNYLKKNKKHIINNFITYLNNNSYHSVLEYINNNFDYSLNFGNVTLNFQINFYQKNNNKFYKYLALQRVIKYIFKYPFMIKYYKTLFKSLYIYLVFNKHYIFKNKYTLCSEVYSMVSRSISLASLDYRGECFFIDHSKFDALPYEIYSLHRKKQLINIDKIYQKNTHLNNNIFTKDKKNLNILIQASDGCGTISTYEYYCYTIILRSLIEYKYDGEIVLKFHPSNSKLSVSLKKKLCEYELNKNLNIIFKHQDKNVEFFASNSFLVISIDYSTSFDEIIKNGTPIIYFNFNDQRHTINTTNLIYKSNKFKMITKKEIFKKELKNQLKNFINNN